MLIVSVSRSMDEFGLTTLGATNSWTVVVSNLWMVDGGSTRQPLGLWSIPWRVIYTASCVKEILHLCELLYALGLTVLGRPELSVCSGGGLIRASSGQSGDDENNVQKSIKMIDWWEISILTCICVHANATSRETPETHWCIWTLIYTSIKPDMTDSD